ncbi:BofC C-terminal domain-containing protein [Gorillibacterium massiliense]|uniref:BofC C-terminal domain-containing protein n=1 Tax=Gorillibacterium massiliense TaxID=1280390 RepID=UPI0004B12471|nr:BofC C-terminal domain-containing protein [Gorillibacterium massiliense]
MGFSNLFKQLKKQLRSKKRWLSLGSVILLAHVATAGTVFASTSAATFLLDSKETPGWEQKIGNKSPSDTLQAIRQRTGYFQVTVKTNYICGEEDQALGLMDSTAIVKYAEQHPEFVPVMSGGNAVFFSRTVDDLSPHCKKSAYFGVDRQGNLTLFDGQPDEERVIRTFFQLNVEQMKSSLPAGVWSQLQGGIRVADMAEFNSVLSTFSDYAASDELREKQ